MGAPAENPSDTMLTTAHFKAAFFNAAFFFAAEQSIRASAATETTMARPIWNGTISFGLLNVPVQLHSGERSLDLHFRMLDSARQRAGALRARQRRDRRGSAVEGNRQGASSTTRAATSCSSAEDIRKAAAPESP